MIYLIESDIPKLGAIADVICRSKASEI